MDMAIPLKFDLNKPVSGEASIDLDYSRKVVFEIVGDRFFENYPKWAEEVAEFEPLDGDQVHVGARARQVRKDSGVEVESVFEITEFRPTFKLAFQGISAPYRQTYLLEDGEARQSTRLTFRFELLELEIFMRPFEKLIRFAIEEGTENTVGNIKKLVGAGNA
ncbi:MAG: SRPBCC family protein, partial [Gammaproteobacteria bacterium]